jgi:hypothetical protein
MRDLIGPFLGNCIIVDKINEDWAGFVARNCRLQGLKRG